MKKIIPLLFCIFVFAKSQAQTAIKAEGQDLIIQLQSIGSDVAFSLAKSSFTNGQLQFRKTLCAKLGIHLFSANVGTSIDLLVEELSANHHIAHVQMDAPVDVRQTTPNDPLWPDQWHFEQIGLTDAWDVSTGGTTANGDEIVVAVIDSGFDITHEDLQGNIWENKLEAQGLSNYDDDGNGKEDDVNGWNFINDTPTLSVTGHGTGVSGIIGANGDNNLGITGVNWDVKMMYLTIDLISEVISAFDYVIDQRERYNDSNGAEGSFVVATNGSFGKNAVFCSDEPLWGAMYDELGKVGVLSVAATANENWDVDEVGDMPTTCTSEYLVAVTATDSDDIRVSNAAFGPASIDLAAPGRNISALTLQDKYTNSFGGTSSACPHVTGAIALLYSMPCTGFADLAISDPAAAALLMKKTILENVVPLSSLQGKTLTGGRLDVFESMKYLHAYCIAMEEEQLAGNFKEIYITDKNFIRVFPNPVADQLMIDYSNDGFTEFSIKVYNSIGQEMELQKVKTTKPFIGQTILVDVKDWSAGTYFVTITGIDEDITTTFIKI